MLKLFSLLDIKWEITKLPMVVGGTATFGTLEFWFIFTTGCGGLVKRSFISEAQFLFP